MLWSSGAGGEGGHPIPQPPPLRIPPNRLLSHILNPGANSYLKIVFSNFLKELFHISKGTKSIYKFIINFLTVRAPLGCPLPSLCKSGIESLCFFHHKEETQF